ncbi:MAG: hypothetical protein EA416_17340 [Trueperaceae bacterium]|nr:MAG: hypothetical protein EA416_17340 [Trueperaceae bacterium]
MPGRPPRPSDQDDLRASRDAGERAARQAQRSARRRLGGSLLAISVLLTVYALWAPRTGPPLDATPSAVEACGPHAPADATPVSLPVDSTATWHALRGVLVCFTHDLTITETFDLGRHGELLLADHRLYGDNTGLEVDDPTLHVVRLGARQRPPAGAAWPLPWGLEVGGVRVGDAVLGLVGRVWTSPAGGYLIEPQGTPRFEVRNPRPEAPPALPGDLRIAAFNTQNYFLTLGSRGADHPAALERQTATLVAALARLDADVIALMEIERDDDGAALRTLAAALNAALEADARDTSGPAGSPQRVYLALPEPSVSASRAGDAIRQGFLIDTATVELVALGADVAGVHERPPQVATLRHLASGEVVSVIAVHLRSKAGCPASGDVDAGFGCWNLRRTRQAQALLAFAARLERDLEHAGALVIGDLNTHRYEPPLGVFEDAGWEVLTDRVPPEAAVSYVFFGRSAALDHALASARLAPRVADLAYWAINADEPPIAGPGRGAAAPAGFAPDPFRSSDHDPLFVTLQLAGDAARDADAPPGGPVTRPVGATDRAPRRRDGAPRSRPRRGRRSRTGSVDPASPAPRSAACRSRDAGPSTRTGRSTSASSPPQRWGSAEAAGDRRQRAAGPRAHRPRRS